MSRSTPLDFFALRAEANEEESGEGESEGEQVLAATLAELKLVRQL